MRKTLLGLLAVAALLTASASVLAHGRGRVHFGIYFGSPWYPWYYGPAYYYYPPPYYPPPAPEPRVDPVQSWSWYCGEPRGYFPEVRNCPSGWKSVPAAPRPPEAAVN